MQKKIMISLDDRLLEDVDKFANDKFISRSSLCAIALGEIMQKRSVFESTNPQNANLMIKDAKLIQDIEYYAQEANMSPNAFVSYACKYAIKNLGDFQNYFDRLY